MPLLLISIIPWPLRMPPLMLISLKEKSVPPVSLVSPAVWVKLVKFRMPVSTSTVPVLLKATETVVVSVSELSDLRKVPALENRASLPSSEALKKLAEMLSAELPEAMKVAPATFSIVPEPGMEVKLTLTLRLREPPVQVSVFSLRRVRPPSRKKPLELMEVGPWRMVVPEPRWSPKVSAEAPVTVRLPVPAREPLDWVSVSTNGQIAAGVERGNREGGERARSVEDRCPETCRNDNVIG